MAYATINDVQARMTTTLTEAQSQVCGTLLDDAAVIIDACNYSASAEAKMVVSCRMVIRAMNSAGAIGIPVGASQGSASALGYSQSWTLGTGGATGELYLGKADRKLLGVGDKIGSYSPVEELEGEI